MATQAELRAERRRVYALVNRASALCVEQGIWGGPIYIDALRAALAFDGGNLPLAEELASHVVGGLTRKEDAP